MKNLLIPFFVLFIIACSPNLPKKGSQELALAVSLDSMFAWDIEKQPSGALMYLDVPYLRQIDCDTCKVEYLTLSVAKYDSLTRPHWIALILPNKIVREEGLFLFFKKSGLKADPKAMQDSTENSVRVKFEEGHTETFTARFKNGFALDENNRKVDIYQKFLSYDRIYFMIFLPDGGHKTIAVPLHHFKEQYAELEKERFMQHAK